MLRVDFDEMFSDVITQRPRFAAGILECLVDGPQETQEIARRSNMSLCTVLVYDGDIAPSIEADGYIDALVPARQLLGL